MKPGSAAARAGLRDGQKATRISIWFGDVSKAVKLTVKDDRGEHHIQYLPHANEKIAMPRVTPRQGAPASCRATL